MFSIKLHGHVGFDTATDSPVVRFHQEFSFTRSGVLRQHSDGAAQVYTHGPDSSLQTRLIAAVAIKHYVFDARDAGGGLGYVHDYGPGVLPAGGYVRDDLDLQRT